jgi:SAM-dependent methyltransferase
MTDTAPNSQGYFTEDIYIPAYNPSIDPRMLSASGRFFGFPSAPTDQPFTYGDFGCGLGTDIILLAWALPHGQFFGIDINQQQIEQARKLAAEIGLKNVTFIQSAFGDVDTSILPPLDYAVNTGVISWISNQVRAELVQAISQCVSNNGLVLISYQTIPGTRVEADFRYLLKKMLAKGDGITPAFKKLSVLMNKPAYFNAHDDEGKARKIKLFQHEFISEHWKPVYPSEMLSALSQEGLGFCGPLDTPISVSKLFEETTSVADPLFLMDFYATQYMIGGRMDVFCKAAHIEDAEGKALDQEQNVYRLPFPASAKEKDKQRLSQDAFSKARATRPMTELLKVGSIGPFKQLGWEALKRAGHILVNENREPIPCSGAFKLINPAVKKQLKLKEYASWGEGNIIVPETALILPCPNLIYMILSELSEVPQEKWVGELKQRSKIKIKKKHAKRAISIWKNHWAPILAGHGVIAPLKG